MALPYAEVIGDPIAQSKSPLIHKYWLERCGIEGGYRATRVAAAELPDYIASRRGDPDWRGCNVTIPHKEKVIPLLDRLDPSAEAVGAVNCIVAEGGELTGHNTDIAGVAAALSGVELEDRKAAIVGAGGAARAAIHYLRECDARSIALLVRDPAKAASLQAIDPARIQAWPLAEADEALGSAAAIVNASPMGMTGAAAMSEELLEAIRRHADGAALFDMVYNPLQTLFLECAARHGGTPVDGLTMLIGQAAGAFRLFFGEEPPPAHGELRATLAG